MFVVVNALRTRRNEPDTSACYTQMRQLAGSLAAYAADNDDLLPPAGRWMDATIDRNPPAAYHCTAFKNENDYGIALNSSLAGDKHIPDKNRVLLFDSTNLVRNATAPLETMPNPGRHGGYNVVAFIDSHVRALTPEQIRELAGNAGDTN
jgi:hypothetical protein